MSIRVSVSRAGEGGSLILATLSAGCAAAGWGVAAAGLLIVAFALLSARHHANAWSQLPLAAVLLIVGALILSQLAELMQFRYLADTVSSRLAWTPLVLLCMLASWWCWHQRRTPRQAPTRHVDSMIIHSPALMAAVVGAIALALPVESRAAWFLGGDHVRHLIFSADETVTGYLSYEDSAYPRAWHTLVAHLWALGGANLDAQGFLDLVDVMSVSVWFLYVLLVTSVGSATAALCERAGLGTRVGALAGCGAGVAVLLPAIAAPQFVLGFETSVLAALALSVGVREVLIHLGSLRAVCATAVGAALLAHTWQLLLPPGVVMFIGATFAYALSSRPRHQRIFIVPSASLLALAVAAEGIIAVWSQFGVGHAGEQGAVTPAPAWGVLVCMLAVGAMSAASRFSREILIVGAALLSIVATAVAISGLMSISLEMYYPTKLMWAFIINGVPFVAAVIGWAYEGAERFFSTKAKVFQTLFGMPLLLAFGVSVVSTVTLATGGWSMITDPRTVVAAVTTSDAKSAQIVWLGGERTDDVITRILLDFFRLERLDWTSAKTPQSALSLEEECEILRRAGDPAVLSDVEVTQVADRYDCVPGVRIIRVSIPHSATVAGR